MEALSLEETFKTPNVKFNGSTGDLELKGRVFPENPEDFFAPLFKWLQNYGQDPAPETTMTMFLAYFNSTSSEYLFRICKAIESISDSGHACKLVWEYEPEDEDMKQIGEDYANLLKLNFELKAVI
jgi:hypothetical protein